MNPKELVRDASKVHACLFENGKGELYASKACKIIIPVRYGERKLASITDEIRIVGIFAIVIEDKYYGVSKINAMMQITPTSTNVIKVNGEEYYEFYFDKGSMVCPNLNLVKDDQLAYKIYDEIIAKGNVPWYFSYEDLGKLFTSAKEHAGIRLAANNIPLEMIAASISRSPKNRREYFRHAFKNAVEMNKAYPDFIPLRSVIYGATNTTAKLMGAYFDDGLMSALVNPSDRVEGVEQLLRR